MSLIQNINATLGEQSATAGWDVMVAYDRDRVNKLFHEQYLNKVVANEHYPPFNNESDTYGLIFKDIVLGPPLISFENANVADSAVIIRLKFLSGSIIRTDSDKQVTQWDSISPGNDYALKIKAELKYGTGSVSDGGEISIHFDKGTLMDIEGMNTLPEEVLGIFRNYLKEHAIHYSLGELKNTDNAKLYPKSFIVRTQRHPEASSKASSDNTNGAVLLFIETNYGGKGLFPSDKQPWVIPEGKTATLLISDQLLFGPLLAENFTDRITDFEWKSVYGQGGNKLLQFNKGYVPTTNVIRGNYASIGMHGNMNSSDNSRNPRPARLSMVDFQIGKGDGNKTINGQFSRQGFTDLFRDSGTVTGGHNWDNLVDVPFDRKGKFTATVSLDKDDNVIFNSNTSFELTTSHPSFSLIGTDARLKFAQEAANNLNKSSMFELKEIKTFYLKNILFPGDNILSFSDVAVPGDLALYGDVSESLMSLDITPDDTAIAAGQTQTFSARLPDGSVPADLVWSVDGVGDIDNKGVYTAPAIGEITQAKNVIVTAKTGDNRVGKTLITVLASPLVIMTPFIFIEEGNSPEPFYFKTRVINAQEPLSWSLDSDLADPGTIDSKGMYTPPKAYEDGFNVVTVIARLPSGVEKKAIVCLRDKDTGRAFKAEPAFHPNVTENSSVTFSTRSRDFDADLWEIYPKLGSLSEPEFCQDGKMFIWSSTYSAPQTVDQSDIVLIKMSNKSRYWNSGYGLVELLPSKSAWSRVCSLSFLEVLAADGTPASSIYANERNQCTVNIKITALDKYGKEVFLPAQDVYPYLQLIDYNSGEDISQDGTFAYTDKKNEYNRQPQIQSSSMNIPLYITSSTGETRKKVAVRVKLINPDAEYEYYSTDSGSASGMDSGVTITTKKPINYADPQNIIVTSSSPVKIKENMTFSVKKGDLYHDEYTGECYKQEVKIAPRNGLNTTFKNISIRYSAVLNETVSNGKQDWEEIKDELGFSCLVSNSLKCCSVGGYKMTGQNAPDLQSSTVMFFEANNNAVSDKIHLNGSVYFKDSEGDNKYRFKINNFIEPSPVYEPGVVKFVGYTFHIPKSHAEPLGWSSSLNEIGLDVKDEFGNASVLKVRWDDNQHYLTPAVY